MIKVKVFGCNTYESLEQKVNYFLQEHPDINILFEQVMVGAFGVLIYFLRYDTQ